MVNAQSVLFIALIFCSCASIQPTPLSADISIDENEAIESEKGIPALSYQNGNLMSSSLWWVDSKPGPDLSIKAKDGLFVVSAKDIGPNYNPFGQTFPGLDFSGDLAIKITARSVGEDLPILALQFDDMSGHSANGKRPWQRIDNGPEFRDYYFLLNGCFIQTWPTNGIVDPGLIDKVMIFINPGGNPYTGDIIIKTIQVINAKDAGDTKPIKVLAGKSGGWIDKFDNDISSWGHSKEINLSKEGETLKVDAKEAGPNYENFGKKFPVFNFKNGNKVRVRARNAGSVPVELRIDFKDNDEFTTNADPVVNTIAPDSSGKFKDYYFVYKNKFKQSWPFDHEVDAERIGEILIFLNPGKNPFSGILYIDEIEIEKNIDSDTNSQEGNTPNSDNTIIDNFSKLDLIEWWNGDNTTLSKDKNGLLINTKASSTEQKEFGRAFDPINFQKNELLKLSIKSDKPIKLRIDLKDNMGLSTNKTPLVIDITASTEFKDYLVSFSDKLIDESGKPVDSSKISEIIFYPDYKNTGSSVAFVMKEIKAVKK